MGNRAMNIFIFAAVVISHGGGVSALKMDPKESQGPPGPNGSSGNNTGSQECRQQNRNPNRTCDTSGRSRFGWKEAMNAIRECDLETMKMMIGHECFFRLEVDVLVCRAIILFKIIYNF